MSNKTIYEERADKAEAARDEARRKYKQAENYIEKMDAVIDDLNIAKSCINPLEDLKRATTALKERAEKAEAALAAQNAAPQSPADLASVPSQEGAGQVVAGAAPIVSEQARRREWVGLTEEEKHDCYLKIDVWSRCVEAVEAKLKEKNTCSLKT